VELTTKTRGSDAGEKEETGKFIKGKGGTSNSEGERIWDASIEANRKKYDQERSRYMLRTSHILRSSKRILNRS